MSGTVEIEKFLQQRGIVYCKDATNEEDDYTRNRIRHHILPYAEQNIVKGCVAHNESDGGAAGGDGGLSGTADKRSSWPMYPGNGR